MTKIDLITGFLGSGKTTFLKRYIAHFLAKGERIAVLEFDYGAINIDMMLLQEFNDSIDLEMVAGGCDYDCHLRRFKTKLIAMGMKRYDRVIVEPSGLFDPDEFFDALCEEPLDQWFEVGSVISIVDAGLEENLSEDSRYILMSQLSCSGAIVLSKTQFHSSLEIDKTIERLEAVCKDYGVSINELPIYQKSFDDLNDADFEFLAAVSYKSKPHEKRMVMNKNAYQVCYFMDMKIDAVSLEKAAKTLFTNQIYGNIQRIKGFLYEGGTWHEFNATKEETSLSVVANGQNVFIVIGENLNEKCIKSLFSEPKK